MSIKVIKEGHQYGCDSDVPVVMMMFQDGPIKEVGEKNGWQNEEVLEALIHRLNYLNRLFPCRENSITITKLEEALMWQKKRTEDRVSRGVEGTNVA